MNSLQQLIQQIKLEMQIKNILITTVDYNKHTGTVSFAVTVECGLHSELATTQFTAEWFLASVNANMSNQIARLLKDFIA